MDYKKLDLIVEQFTEKNDNQRYIQSLDKTLPMCMGIIQKNIPNIEEKWSRTFELNESINIIIQFLNSIDTNLASEFSNIIYSVDEKGDPIVNFKPKANEDSEKDYLDHSSGKVFINYDNTPNDIFIILHEVLHKLNQCDIVNKEGTVQTFAREYYTETVSYIGERLLGEYLVSNGVLTENDFELRKKERLISSKEWARNVIVQSELLKIKSRGMELNRDNILTYFNNYDKNSPFYPIILDEFRDLRRTTQILSDGDLDIPISQRYVIAQSIADDFVNNNYSVDDFLSLHYAIADPNADIDKINYEVEKRNKKK